MLTIGLNRAVDLIQTKASRGGGKTAALREVGLHPEDNKPVTVHEGRYGAYAKHGKTNATLPKDSDPMTISLADALALLAARAAKGGKAPKKSAATKSKTKKTKAVVENGEDKPAKKTAKKPAAKKPAAKVAKTATGGKAKAKKPAVPVPSSN